MGIKRFHKHKRPKRVQNYRLCLILILLLQLSGMAGYYLYQAADSVPGKIILYENRKELLDLDLPFQGMLSSDDIHAVSIQNDKKANGNFNLDHPVQMTGNNIGSYQANLKLFGVIPCGSLKIDVIPETKVMPSGDAVGIYLESDGIMILGTSDIRGEDGFVYHPAEGILQAGDYLLSINDTNVQNIAQVSAILQENEKDTLHLKIRRGNSKIDVKLNPVRTAGGTYQLGVWLREDTEGIGTMTCVLEDGTFAALGHGITDVDTGLLINLQDGGLYKATVNQVIAGKKGSPGELSGSVHLSDSDKIGSVYTNNIWGISGKVSDTSYQYRENEGIPLALKQEIKTGKATIRCQLDSAVKEYEIEIEEIHLNAKDKKGLVLRVTDPELLEKTGGIVQGMSGSPILQNGKLIGAVTHVFVNNPTKGYGIFIEEMLGE
ncbi:MAG: SpoIVB peptidase [Lachnospiraceae bacterium]|nr:SpoIVB peptidase [Lachnospiraceae bacterium]